MNSDWIHQGTQLVGVNTDDDFGLTTYLNRFVNDTRLYEFLSQAKELDPDKFDEILLLDKLRTPYSGFDTKNNIPNYVNYGGPGIRPNLWYSQVREILTKPSHPEKIMVKELKTGETWHQKPRQLVDQLMPFLTTDLYSFLFESAYGVCGQSGQQPDIPGIVVVTGSLGADPGLINTIVKECFSLKTKSSPQLQTAILPSNLSSLIPSMHHTSVDRDIAFREVIDILSKSKPPKDTIDSDLTLRRPLYPRRTAPRSQKPSL